jgi:RimJ/RimL family protein N-acetyltransferase
MEPKLDWQMVIRNLGLKWVEDTKGILAIDLDKGQCVAGCILNNWTWNAAMIHLWIDNPLVLRHGFFQEIADYVFIQAGKEVLIGMVPGDNEDALKLNKHIGFKETHRIKGGFMHDIDYVIMEANKASLAHWLKKEEMEVA